MRHTTFKNEKKHTVQEANKCLGLTKMLKNSEGYTMTCNKDIKYN